MRNPSRVLLIIHMGSHCVKIEQCMILKQEAM